MKVSFGIPSIMSDAYKDNNLIMRYLFVKSFEELEAECCDLFKKDNIF